jgi:hypothetical protein
MSRLEDVFGEFGRERRAGSSRLAVRAVSSLLMGIEKIMRPRNPSGSVTGGATSSSSDDENRRKWDVSDETGL